MNKYTVWGKMVCEGLIPFALLGVFYFDTVSAQVTYSCFAFMSVVVLALILNADVSVAYLVASLGMVPEYQGNAFAQFIVVIALALMIIYAVINSANSGLPMRYYAIRYLAGLAVVGVMVSGAQMGYLVTAIVAALIATLLPVIVWKREMMLVNSSRGVNRR